MADQHKRSILKAISYRITGSTFTVLVSWAVSGKVKVALSIGLVELFTKTGIFYLHERIWTKVRFGTGPREDYQI